MRGQGQHATVAEDPPPPVVAGGLGRGSDTEIKAPSSGRRQRSTVMPSVSEPFGIAPLEAIQNDVPVIISKNSGVR